MKVQELIRKDHLKEKDPKVLNKKKEEKRVRIQEEKKCAIKKVEKMEEK